jgi:hypothetical protein
MRQFEKIGHFMSLACVLMALSSPAFGCSAGDKTEDIIYGCNQFIKFARKGYSRNDADTMRHLGECLGAVRTMLATEIAGDFICPSNEVKLIHAVTAFSLYVIQHPSELTAFYVVPMRQAFRAAYPCPGRNP